MSLDVLRATLTELFAHASDRAETVGLLNDVRRLVCEFSPFAAEPVAAYQEYRAMKRQRALGINDDVPGFEDAQSVLL